MHYLLGIDTSTTASKALLCDNTGTVVASHSVSHPGFAVTDKPLWSEQDPEDWWAATSQVIRALIKNQDASLIAGIGLTGQMQGLVILDKNQAIIRPALLWNDQRSSAECEWLTNEFGKEFLCDHIGTIPLPCHLLSKLLWLKTHEPDTYQRIAHILTPKDYIRWRLSNVFATDKTDASGFGLLDIATRQWSKELTQALSIPASWLPQLFESTDITSHLSHTAAAETGLTAGIPIAAGAGDQPAEGIGCGLFIPGKISIQTGTSGVVVSIKNTYAPDPEGRFLEYCHAVHNQWISMGLTASAAGSLRWFRDNFASHLSFQALDTLAETTKAGANGLLFIPDICGNIHPHANPLARGAFIGLTERHTLAHMARAVMEGVGFSLYEMAELMCATANNTPDNFIISGGAANSNLWKIIFAEIFQKPLLTLPHQEGAAFGAALIAGVATNIWPSYSSMQTQLTKIDQVIQPSTAGISMYRQLYPLWKKSYGQCREINVGLSKII